MPEMLTPLEKSMLIPALTEEEIKKALGEEQVSQKHGKNFKKPFAVFHMGTEAFQG